MEICTHIICRVGMCLGAALGLTERIIAYIMTKKFSEFPKIHKASIHEF